VAALCRSLLAAGVVDIGLNVKATNAAAIKLYQNLGFGITSSHGEFLITRAV
jgi:ribosomal protein S18 acetylase RimI-like enzyme